MTRPEAAEQTQADVIAAGGVLWRVRPDTALQVALVHRPRYDDWTLPKGKVETGELVSAAAVREIAEETGQRARLGARLGQVRYHVPEGEKVVHYWAAEAQSGEFVPNAEVDGLRWLTPAQAIVALSYRRDVDVLNRFAALGRTDGELLLVRHGKAGSRRAWAGPDDLRPLSTGGGRQAAALREALLPFGPERIYSAAPVRCVQTVQPLADALGLDIAIEPLLGEDGYWARPDKGLRRLVEIGAQGGVNLVCSQGGVIPDVVRTLPRSGPARHGPDASDSPESRKASTWLLGLRERRLLFADYYPPPT